MRLFLGIELPAETKKQLYDSLEGMRLKHPEFKWVDTKNYHITLHFFGEIENTDAVIKRLNDILYDAESFYLYSLKMDIFVRKQLLLHLTFKRQKKMEQLVATIKRDLGVDEKLDFIPHVTVSRSALSSKQQYFALNNEIEKKDIDLEFKVAKVYLFESIITGKQPTYNKIAEFKLIDP